MSTPSSPPSRTRRAAAANAATTSSIMVLVISMGIVPAMGLGTALADQASGMAALLAPE